MRTARMTVLMTPDEKSDLEADAARLGVSGGEYVRLAVGNFANAREMRELEFIAEQLSAAVPAMAASLDRSGDTLDRINARLQSTLEQLGAR